MRVLGSFGLANTVLHFFFINLVFVQSITKHFYSIFRLKFFLKFKFNSKIFPLLFSMNYSSVSQFSVQLNFQRIHSRFLGFRQKIPRKALKSSWNIKKWQFCLILKKLFDVGFGEFFNLYLSFLFLFNFLECFLYIFLFLGKEWIKRSSS
jgi:hypothetical protein